MTPSQLRRGYGPIYRYLSRCGNDLSAPAKSVLFSLLERLGENASAWPSQQTIASDTGFSERSVRSALGELGERGFVESRRRGLGLTNLYTVDIEAILSWAENGNGHRCAPAMVAATELPPTALRRTTIEEPPLEDSLSNESEDAARELRPKKTAITTAFKERMRSTYGPGLADFEEAWAFHLDSSYLRKKLDKQAYMDGRLAAAVKREAERRTQNGNGNRLTGGRRSGAPDAEVHDRSAYGTAALRLRANFVEG